MKPGHFVNALVGLSGFFLMASASAGPVSPTAFRFDDLDLRDPHAFVSFLGCRDVTDVQLVGFSINNEIQTNIQTDANSDGLLDLSLLVALRPYDITQPTNPSVFGSSDCTAPLGSTTCVTAIVPAIDGPAALTPATCLAPVADTTSGYTPPVTSSTAPCFVTPAGTVTLDVGGVPLPLIDAQVAARFGNSPPSFVTDGLLRGFLRESDADSTLIPDGVPLLEGQPISVMFPGGTNNCSSNDDRDTHNGVSGWWVYLNFTASRVFLQSDPGPLLSDGFESVVR